MSDINTVTLTGRLTKDPELRTTTSGTSVVNSGLAVERYRKDQDDDVSFFEITVFGNFAELVAKKARKGDSVVVEGRLEQRRWQTDDGQNRSAVSVICNQMKGEFLFRKADGSDTPAAEAGQTTIDDATPASAPAPAGTVADDDIPF
jgi:single-strand DNA-binding protein